MGDFFGSIPLVGSVLKGIVNIVGGSLKTIGGILTGDPDTIRSGMTTVGQGATEIASYVFKDAGGAVLGNASHLYTLPRDFFNLGASIISFDLKKIARSTQDLAMGILVIRNGFYTGAGYGKNTNPNAPTQYFHFDAPSRLHDFEKINEFGWIKSAWKESGVGPYGQVVRAVGTIGFGIYGMITGQRW